MCLVTAANNHLAKLQLIQNECLRIILKVPAYMPIARMNDSGNQANVREEEEARKRRQAPREG